MSTLGERVVGIDTNILIYAFQDERNVDHEGARLRRRYARRLLAALSDDQKQPVLSIISVAEYLVKIPEVEHANVFRQLQTGFQIAPFSRQAASIAARLVNQCGKRPSAYKVIGGRHVLMADIKIIASLRSANVSVAYFNDGGARKIACHLMDARPLPLTPTSLLELIEDRDAESGHG